MHQTRVSSHLLPAAILFILGGAALAVEPLLELESAANEVDSKFVVSNLPDSIMKNASKRSDEEWQAVFSVHTVIDSRVSPTAILGEYSIPEKSRNRVTFSPRYPLSRDVAYRAILRLPGSSANESTELKKDFHLKALPPKPATQLTAIYPTRDVLPENLLKFYLHFSAPMSRGEVYSRVKLRDGNGKQVEAPFLELSEELWSPDGMRLTLYFDPGRIKRGLQPRELFGPALLEGGQYTLEIDPKWPDAEGNPVKAPEKLITKSFRVTAPDDQQPDLKRWKIFTPTAGTRIPLTIEFDEPLDSAMLVRVLSVHDANAGLVAGEVGVGKNESSWTFRPAANWKPGLHSLVVATALEDLAGNSLGRPFEVDVFRPLKSSLSAETATLTFEVKSAAR